MRLLHTADWHLGRLFHGVSLVDDQAHLLDELARLVAEARIDAVLIAGDVYDRAVPPPRNSSAAKRAVISQLNAHRPWAIKDPRLSLLASEWLPLRPWHAFRFSTQNVTSKSWLGPRWSLQG